MQASVHTQYASLEANVPSYGLLRIQTVVSNNDVPKLNIVGMFDQSISMRADERNLQALQNTIIEGAAAMKGGTLSIINFATDVEIPIRASVVPSEDLDEWKLQTAGELGPYMTGGCTNTYGAMNAVVDLLAGMNGQSVVFMATDGDPTIGDVVEPLEIARRVSEKAKGLNHGLFDFVILGLGTSLDIDKCRQAGRGLHPQVRFIQTDMKTIAGDIGQILGDEIISTSVEVSIVGATLMDPSQSVLLNVKHNQQIDIPLSIPCAGKITVTILASGHESVCVEHELKEGKKEETNEEVAWICTRYKIKNLLQRFNAKQDVAFLKEARALADLFESLEANKLKIQIAKLGAARSQSARCNVFQDVDDSCRIVSQQATQSQHRYSEIYNKFSQSVDPFSSMKCTKRRRRDEDVASKKSKLAAMLVPGFTSASLLLSEVSTNPTSVPVAIDKLIVFSKSQRRYVELHRNKAERACCDALSQPESWCSSVYACNVPVLEFPQLHL
jgi:hypothetical protein